MNAFDVGFREGLVKAAAMTARVDHAIRELRARHHKDLAESFRSVASTGVNHPFEERLMKRLHNIPGFTDAVRDALKAHPKATAQAAASGGPRAAVFRAAKAVKANKAAVAAGAVGVAGVAAAAHHGSKPEYQRLGEKPKVRAA